MATFRIPIDLTWTGASGSPGVNVFHGRGGDPIPDPADVQGLADMLEEFYTDISAIIAAGVTISWAGEAQGVGDDTGTTYNGTPWTVAGTGGGGFAPPADAMLVQWMTGSGGRSGRGRTFISPLTQALIEANGTPDETARTTLDDAADALVSSSQGFGNGALGVYSRTQDIFRDFQSAEVPNYFAVLRSRRD